MPKRRTAWSAVGPPAGIEAARNGVRCSTGRGGIANIVQVERAYSAGNAPTDAQSLLRRLQKALQDQTLDTVRAGLDRWYASHRDQLQRPVIETLWFEMALPGLQKVR